MSGDIHLEMSSDTPAKPKPGDITFSLPEVVAISDVSAATIKNWIRDDPGYRASGRGGVLRMQFAAPGKGGQRRFSISDLVGIAAMGVLTGMKIPPLAGAACISRVQARAASVMFGLMVQSNIEEMAGETVEPDVSRVYVFWPIIDSDEWGYREGHLVGPNANLDPNTLPTGFVVFQVDKLIHLLIRAVSELLMARKHQ